MFVDAVAFLPMQDKKTHHLMLCAAAYSSEEIALTSV